MAQLQANRTLSGSFASVWVDGALIAELESITVKVKLQRERVQFGMDVEMVKKYLSKEQVHDQILTQKAVAVVVDSATAVKAEKKPAKKTAKKAAEKAE
mgnify:CR=1 FL=1